MIQEDVIVDLGIGGISTGQRIGSGASADVFRAEQPALGRTVAVKVITAPSIDAAIVRRFGHENRALGALSAHPNIVTVYDAGISQRGRPYVVMQFVEGGSLEGVRLPPDQVVEIGAAIAGALAEAHEHPRRILHRDVKPANILVDGYGTPLLADFGLAVFTEGHRQQTIESIGTPAFMAPELFYDAEPSVRTDVYGLGATLYALATGHAPFSADDPSTVTLIRRVATEQLDPLPDGRLGEFIGWAMSTDPAARPASMLECVQALRSIQHESVAASSPPLGVSGGRPPGPVAPDLEPAVASGRGGIIGWFALALVLGALLAGFMFSTTTGSEEANPAAGAASARREPAAEVSRDDNEPTSTSAVLGMPATDRDPGAASGGVRDEETIGVRLSPTSVPAVVVTTGCVSDPLIPALVPTGAVMTTVDGCPYWRSTLAVSGEMHEYSLDLGLGQMVTVVSNAAFTSVVTPSDVPIFAAGPSGGNHTFVAAEAGTYRVRVGGPAAIEPGPQTIAFFTTER